MSQKSPTRLRGWPSISRPTPRAIPRSASSPAATAMKQPVTGREAVFWRRLIALREIATSKWGKLTRGERLPHEMRLRNFPDKLIRTQTTRRPAPLAASPSPVWVRTEPGDCVIFNQRLYHSASPMAGPKYAVFLSYATENSHGRNHMGYYRHFRKDLHTARSTRNWPSAR